MSSAAPYAIAFLPLVGSLAGGLLGGKGGGLLGGILGKKGILGKVGGLFGKKKKNKMKQSQLTLARFGGGGGRAGFLPQAEAGIETAIGGYELGGAIYNMTRPRLRSEVMAPADPGMSRPRYRLGAGRPSTMGPLVDAMGRPFCEPGYRISYRVRGREGLPTCVRKRRMNPTNFRALKRSLSRLGAFESVVKRTFHLSGNITPRRRRLSHKRRFALAKRC